MKDKKLLEKLDWELIIWDRLIASYRLSRIRENGESFFIVTDELNEQMNEIRNIIQKIKELK